MVIYLPHEQKYAGNATAAILSLTEVDYLTTDQIIQFGDIFHVKNSRTVVPRLVGDITL